MAADLYEEAYMENELLTRLYGEFCSLRGEMSEFKRRTLERLEELEANLRRASAEKTARICQVVSILTGAAALASATFTVLKVFLGADA